MRIYLAARYSRVSEMQQYAIQLAAIGHEVTSRWIQRSHQMLTEMSLDNPHYGLEARFAQEDLEDLKKADCILCFSEAPRSTNSRGGRHVEFGAAMAWNMRLIIIGPRENVFHHIPSIEVYDNWDELWQALQNAVQMQAQESPAG
jgi:hypothetical protein